MIIVCLILNNPEMERYLFAGFCLFATIRYLHFFISVSIQIKNYLKIPF